MEELLALQAELAKVQSAPSSFKLSEPNVVEVVQKLVELGLLDVLYTMNGKEYLTPRQLLREVEDELAARGGRVNVTELVAILHVDLPYIDAAVATLLREPPPAALGALQLFQGELIAEVYLDSLAEEIALQLHGAGRLSIGELAVQHTLTSEFLLRLVEPRLGSAIDATLSGGALYTAAYVARHTARVRGVLSGVTRPVSLPQLVREHGFNESLFADCVAELLACGRLRGALYGKSTFTPEVYTHAQQAAVLSFFTQNGVIEYAALSKMQVKDPRAHMLAQHADGIALSSCFIKRELLEAAEAQVEEACTSGGAIDLYGCFTFTLTDEDLERLVAASPSISSLLSTGRAVRLGDERSLLASSALIEACAKPLGELAAAIAKEKGTAHVQTAASKDDEAPGSSKKGGKAKAGKSKGKKGKGEDGDDDDEDEGGGKRGGKKGKDWRDAALGGDLDDDDDDEVGRGKKGGKKGKDKKKAGGVDMNAAPASSSEDDLLPRLEEKLLQAVPSLEQTTDLAAAMAAHLLPKLLQMVATAVAELQASGVAERRKAVQAAQERLRSLSQNLQLFVKANQAADLPPADAEALDEALLKGTCLELFTAMLHSEALHAGIHLPHLADPEADVTASERKEAMALLPPKPRGALQALEKAAVGKASTPTAFLEALWVAEEVLGEQCVRLDRKREKTALAEARAMLRSQLESTDQAEVALHLSMLLLEIDLNGLFFAAPGHLLHILISHLQPKLSPAAHAALSNCYAEVAASQKQQTDVAFDTEAVRHIGLNKGRAKGDE